MAYPCEETQALLLAPYCTVAFDLRKATAESGVFHAAQSAQQQTKVFNMCDLLTLDKIHIVTSTFLPSSKQNAVMGTTQVALNTPEVLEQILLEVDLRTLLVSAQRVCRSWHELLSASPSLQQHLFLQPAPKSATQAFNPLLAEKFPHWFPSSAGEGDLSSKVFKPKDLEPYELVRKDCRAAFKHERATWRRMLPRQPPIWSFDRYTECDSMGGTFVDVARVSGMGISRPSDDSDPGADDKQPDSDTEPMNMESLYHLITGGHGDCHTWRFAWSGHNNRNPLPAEINRNELGDDMKGKDRSRRKDGLVLLEYRTLQCTGGGPWRFKRKFAVRERDCDVRSWKVKLRNREDPDGEVEERVIYNADYVSESE